MSTTKSVKRKRKKIKQSEPLSPYHHTMTNLWCQGLWDLTRLGHTTETEARKLYDALHVLLAVVDEEIIAAVVETVRSRFAERPTIAAGEVARLLNVSKSTVAQRAKKGTLPEAINTGLKNPVFRRTDVRLWMRHKCKSRTDLAAALRAEANSTTE